MKSSSTGRKREAVRRAWWSASRRRPDTTTAEAVGIHPQPFLMSKFGVCLEQRASNVHPEPSRKFGKGQQRRRSTGHDAREGDERRNGSPRPVARVETRPPPAAWTLSGTYLACPAFQPAAVADRRCARPASRVPQGLAQETRLQSEDQNSSRALASRLRGPAYGPATPRAGRPTLSEPHRPFQPWFSSTAFTSSQST